MGVLTVRYANTLHSDAPLAARAIDGRISGPAGGTHAAIGCAPGLVEPRPRGAVPLLAAGGSGWVMLLPAGGMARAVRKAAVRNVKAPMGTRTMPRPGSLL